MGALSRASLRQHAAVVEAPGAIGLRSQDIPEPAANEVRVRLQGCGLCASSIPVWEGRAWFHYPLEPGVPGHEGWGVVDAVGKDVADLAPGERVALISSHAFAQYDIAPRAAVVRLPDALKSEPFPGEPIGCAMNIFARSDIRAGHSVAIVGGGFLGTLLTQLARGAGADVVVLSRRAYSLCIAREAGATHVFDSSDADDACKRARDVTCDRGFERVIECAGVQSTLDLASALAAERGKLVIAGYHQDGMRQVDMQAWNWLGLDVVNAHERAAEQYARGIEAGIEAVLDGRIDPFPLLTHHVPMTELSRGFDLLCTRPDGFVKAVVTMEVPA
jgi:threonine dehydrogenase-like Zn-dependent dehydrogenase